MSTRHLDHALLFLADILFPHRCWDTFFRSCNRLAISADGKVLCPCCCSGLRVSFNVTVFLSFACCLHSAAAGVDDLQPEMFLSIFACNCDTDCGNRITVAFPAAGNFFTLASRCLLRYSGIPYDRTIAQMEHSESSSCSWQGTHGKALCHFVHCQL